MPTTHYDYLLQSAADFGSKDGPCLIWPYVRIWNGYGRVGRNGKNLLVHRVAFAHFVGPIPKHYDVCHHCDNRLCYRVSHLFTGTRKENVADCRRKGRFAPTHTFSFRGEKSNLAKLTNEQVEEIVRLLRSGSKQQQLADLYGVNQQCISKIARGQRWAHLTAVPHAPVKQWVRLK
jgi:Autographiviridae endonuclease